MRVGVDRSGAAPPPALFSCLPAQEVLDHVRPAIDPDSLLTSQEAARAGRLSLELDRRDFVAARVLARLLIARRHGQGADPAAIAGIAFSQRCERCGAAHGRPFVDVPGERVSWAHAGGYVAAVAGNGPVGVDVEPLTSLGRGAWEGAPDLRSWVRAEALLKWGDGTLDQAATWLPALTGPPSTRGRHYLVGDDGQPRRARGMPAGVRGVVVTDAPRAAVPVACSAATEARAQWVDPLS
ncbi:hypothetical protein BJ986_001780 [Phycicoccus badiiscoriae]|uniref:4'-phosphopantetheinyl transferase n=1 Tax=Pedococcus badiiscoriae TaxID=642776 RepID=A0A852WDM4_9MICO|nr:hypothetical protein [Pedococcus badiiscoriae]